MMSLLPMAVLTVFQRGFGLGQGLLDRAVALIATAFLGQALHVVTQGVEPSGREDAGLAHPAAQALAREPRRRAAAILPETRVSPRSACPWQAERSLGR